MLELRETAEGRHKVLHGVRGEGGAGRERPGEDGARTEKVGIRAGHRSGDDTAEEKPADDGRHYFNRKKLHWT